MDNSEVQQQSHPGDGSSTDHDLAAEAAATLRESPKRLPTKLLYDERGSKLFDQICIQPEYYPTRTELGLLEGVAGKVADESRARELLELGAGMARKTHALLKAMTGQDGKVHYLPMDISSSALDVARQHVEERFPQVAVKPVVADYSRPMTSPHRQGTRMMAFLGSTIGNFDPSAADEVLENVSPCLDEGEWFLVGTDLVKPREVLEAAYNDSAGVTAAFNKNILSVTNRLLDADFNENDFEHVAFFNDQENRVELHLEARTEIEVSLNQTDEIVSMKKGERIFTEVSRKFTRPAVGELLERNGYELHKWYESDNGYFALSLARRTG